jgi:NADH:ubiquinone oxidoreductase subunit F (NADH-binding)
MTITGLCSIINDQIILIKIEQFYNNISVHFCTPCAAGWHPAWQKFFVVNSQEERLTKCSSAKRI